MFIYWYIWATIVVMNLVNLPKNKGGEIFLFIFSAFIFIFIGGRFEVGGDWFSYLYIFDLYKADSFFKVAGSSEYGYGFFNWLAHQLNYSISFVNFVCAFCLVIGFSQLSRQFEHLFLAFLIAFSYTIIAVGMGYTRQSAAIGLVCYAFSTLFAQDPKKWKFFVWIALAYLFHKSAIIFLAFLPLINSEFYKNKIFYLYSLFVILFSFYIIYMISQGESAYTSGELSSAGAVFRIALHLLPIVVYLWQRHIFVESYPNTYRLLDLMCILILIFLPVSFVYSTIADRFNLYFVIFDIAVFGKFFEYLESFELKALFLIALIIENTMLFFIWINYSPYALCCFDYRNVLFM
ncbi:EpsG family protein [Actinobacillus equuli subsp. equuli]|uniref:EpsG family protein n=1 Tax=Actinobacillus equuli TaxID=718 RepID=UPI0024424676|nr:EpsG family protein [Actinobacillus equuli]WGE55127.1 EpsG family protein [Actinobacillus equuli subsp. equuli]